MNQSPAANSAQSAGRCGTGRCHCALPLVVLLLAISCARAPTKRAIGDQAEVPIVSAAPVTTRIVPATLVATGSLVGEETAQVTFAVSGKLLSLPGSVGASVSAGSIIAEVDQAEFELRVHQARAAEAQALLNLRQTENRVVAESGKPFDPSQQPSVVVASSNRQSAQDQAQSSRLNLKRYQDLLNSGDVSLAAVEQARQQSLISDAQLASADAQYRSELAAAKTAMESVAAARANYDSAKASVKLAERSLANCKVRSPIDGYLLSRSVNLGEFANAGAVAATVVRTRPILMDAVIPEGRDGLLSPGLRVLVTVPSHPGRTFTGRVRYINPAMDAASRSIIAKVALENPAGELRPGMFAKAEFQLSKQETAYFVPAKAILSTGSDGAPTAFVLQGGRVQARIVRAAESVEGFRRVLSGLTPSDQVALPVSGTLTDGAQVRRQP